jgi:hypothetical protein
VARLAVVVACVWLTTACAGCFVLDPLRIPTDDEVLERLGNSNIVVIDDMALFRGLASETLSVRGNGCLAATQDGILFVTWLPKRRIWIPRSKMVDVQAPSHSWLRLTFVDDDGRKDTAVWEVKDAESWLQAFPSPAL